MSENGRFCVQFSGIEKNGIVKTRILYKQSTTDEVREAWRMIYNTEPPHNVQLFVGGQSSYSLNDKNDFRVVMAMAEDQYRAQPSNPLRITLSQPREYNLNTPPSSNPSPEHLNATSVSANNSKEGQDRKSPLKENNQANSSPPKSKTVLEKEDDNAVVHDLSLKKILNNSPREDCRKHDSMVFHGHNENKRNFTNSFIDNNVDQRNSKRFPVPSNLTVEMLNQNQKFENRIAMLPQPQHVSAPVHPYANVSIANLILNVAMQQQRILSSNPKASQIIQTMMSNSEKSSELTSCQTVPNLSFNNPTAFGENRNDPRYFQSLEKSVSSLNNPHSQLVPKRKQTRKMKENSKERGGKRMRSTSSNSNIDFHCARALEYMNLPPTQKKDHNSAHRSHWKHLYHVTNIWPEFRTIYKNKKYDEWSSEARDIYAITLPNEYKWSFLTLAKQGDQLCQRIKSRVESMRETPLAQRPKWCPSDETMQITWTKADERFKQLERIREERETEKLSKSRPSKIVGAKRSASTSVSSLLGQDSSLRPNIFGSGPRFFNPGNFSRYGYSFNPCPSNSSAPALNFPNPYTSSSGINIACARSGATALNSEPGTSDRSAFLLHQMNMIGLANCLDRTALAGVGNSQVEKEKKESASSSVQSNSESATSSSSQ